MATKTLIFDKVIIGGDDYSLHLMESVSIPVEDNNDMVEDGQTLISSYDASFEFKLYDSNIATSNVVNSNSAVDPVKTNVVFSGVSGGATLTFTNTIVNIKPDFEENRSAYVVSGSKRGVDINVVGIS